MSEIGVVGAGAWGTALALHAARAGAGVTLWARRPETIGGENPRLPGYRLPRSVRVTSELPRHADAILLAVPMQNMREVLLRMRPAAPLLLCCKGLEAGSLRLPLEIAAEIVPGHPAGVLTGPNFAAGVASGLPTAAVVAAQDAALRRMFADLLATAAFRLYGNDDPVGAQLGGAAKNVVAIAAGVVIGAGLGDNARAALITRGLAEISRLAAALGGKAETVAGLSGLGDLVLTCTGASSRNFAHGLALGQGRTAAESGGVVEGIKTAGALVARAQNVDLPICQAVADLLAGRTGLEKTIAGLLARPLRDE